VARPHFRIRCEARDAQTDERGFAAFPGDVLTFELLDTEGVYAWELQVSGGPRTNESVLTANPPAKSQPDVPDLELEGETTGPLVSPARGPRGTITTTVPAELDFVAAWVVRSIVNGGLSGSPPRLDQRLIVERVIAVEVSGPDGLQLRPLVKGERTEYSLEGWPKVVNDMIRAVAAGGVGGGLGEGPQGTPGSQGAQGVQGVQGTQGAAGGGGTLGAFGAQGPDGEDGLLGPPGAQGPDGEDGPDGADGAQGAAGAQGAQGAAGDAGAQGAQGASGQAGAQGAAGAVGAAGAQGAPGTQGTQGVQGTQGTQGPQGLGLPVLRYFLLGPSFVDENVGVPLVAGASLDANFASDTGDIIVSPASTGNLVLHCDGQPGRTILLQIGTQDGNEIVPPSWFRQVSKQSATVGDGGPYQQELWLGVVPPGTSPFTNVSVVCNHTSGRGTGDRFIGQAINLSYPVAIDDWDIVATSGSSHVAPAITGGQGADMLGLYLFQGRLTDYSAATGSSVTWTELGTERTAGATGIGIHAQSAVVPDAGATAGTMSTPQPSAMNIAMLLLGLRGACIGEIELEDLLEIGADTVGVFAHVLQIGGYFSFARVYANLHVAQDDFWVGDTRYLVESEVAPDMPAGEIDGLRFCIVGTKLRLEIATGGISSPAQFIAALTVTPPVEPVASSALPTMPEWIAVGTADTAGTSSATPAYGTNQAGDLFVMIVSGRISAFTTPTGWTLQGGPNEQAGRRVYILTRDARSSGGESGTVTVTLTANSQVSTIHTIRGAALASFIEDVTNGGSAANGGTLSAPTIDAGGNARLALFASASGSQVTYIEVTGESGGDWRLRAQANSGTGSNCDQGLYSADMPVGGSVSGGTASIAGIDEHSLVGLALVGVADGTPYAVAAGAGVNGTGTLAVPQVAAPAGTRAYLHVFVRTGSGQAPNTPSGWSLVAGPHAGTSGTCQQWVYREDTDRTGSESGTLSVTFAAGASAKSARMYAFANDSGAAVEDVDVALSTDSPVAMPAVTAGGSYRRAVAFVGIDDDNAIAAATGATGGTWHEAFDEYLGGTTTCLQLQTAGLNNGGTITGGSAVMSGTDDAVVTSFAIVGTGP
jgi:hypothetical protein